jgi:hypothetical protein
MKLKDTIRGIIREEIKKVINEAKSFEFTIDYNTDDDDIEYIENLLKKAKVNAYAEKGTFDDEMVIKAGDAIELRKAKKAIQADGFEINESIVTEAVKEVVLSNEILDFLEERGILKGSDAQKVHKDLTAFLKEKGIR